MKPKWLSIVMALTLAVSMWVALPAVPASAESSSCTGACTRAHIGDRIIYTFTGNGTLIASRTFTADILVVGGGGGGGGAVGDGDYSVGGGGGAGGFVSQTGVALTAQQYNVTVGAGGAAGTYVAKGGNGGNSVFAGYTAYGGGGAGSGSSSNGDLTDGLSGGSGGGGGQRWYEYWAINYYGLPGAGTSGQGNAGAGADYYYNNGRWYLIGGGGGGAGAAASYQNGGNGAASSISGASVTYAGGGGAGVGSPWGSPGTGGSGGGGAGVSYGNGNAGAANSGGGGGGACNGGYAIYPNGGAGGSGIVIVSLPASPTAVTLESMAAVAAPEGGRIDVTWTTAQETDNQGFNLWRGTARDAPDLIKLNADIIPSRAPGNGMGADYAYTDTYELIVGTTYYYWLEDVSLAGATTRHEPVSVTYLGPTAVGLADFRATTAAGRSLAGLVAVAIAALAGAALRRRRG